MNLLEMYEKNKQLQAELSEINTKKVDLVTRIKSLDKVDKSIEKELADLNASFADTAEKLDTLNAKIKEKEQRDEESVENAELEKSKHLKNGGRKEMELTGKNYLNSEQAVKDYSKILLETRGGDAFTKGVRELLATKGFTNGEVLMPGAIVKDIVSILDNEDSFYNQLNHTGLNGPIKTPINLDKTIQAYGHVPGNTKKEQQIALSIIEIHEDAIYKYLTVPRSLTRSNSSDAILAYVMRELPQMVIMAIERAVVVGDGLAPTDKDKINSFQAIVDSELVKEVNAANIDDAIDAFIGDVSALSYKGNLIAVMSSQLQTALKTARDANGIRLFPIGTDLAEAIGVKHIYTPVWMDGLTAVAFDTKAYDVCGKNSLAMDSFDNFVLKENETEYLAEVYAGGALVKPNAAVKITVADTKSTTKTTK